MSEQFDYLEFDDNIVLLCRTQNKMQNKLSALDERPHQLGITIHWERQQYENKSAQAAAAEEEKKEGGAGGGIGEGGEGEEEE